MQNRYLSSPPAIYTANKASDKGPSEKRDNLPTKDTLLDPLSYISRSSLRSRPPQTRKGCVVASQSVLCTEVSLLASGGDLLTYVRAYSCRYEAVTLACCVLPVTAGLDYRPIKKSTLTFPEGSRNGETSCVDISIVDDLAFEKLEVFLLHIGAIEKNIIIHKPYYVPIFIYDDEGELLIQ